MPNELPWYLCQFYQNHSNTLQNVYHWTSNYLAVVQVKKYVLVICDYATRYPEAVPLHSTDASPIAEAVFWRVGIPSEIFADQGSNFTSQLLTKLYWMLHGHLIRTSPYHLQTDGLVERFNQTLKSMLRKAATKEGCDCDKMILFLLFAYREVPQSSTGFSPFEFRIILWQTNQRTIGYIAKILGS